MVSGVSTAVMQNWLRDVLEVERRIIVIDNTVRNLDDSISKAGKYDTPKPIVKASALDSAPELLVNILTYLPIVIVNALWIHRVVTYKSNPNSGGLLTGEARTFALGVINIVSILFVLGVTLYLSKFLKAIATLLASIPGHFIARNQNAEAKAKYDAELTSRKDAASKRLATVPRLKNERQIMQSVLNELMKKRAQLYRTNYLDKAYCSLVPVGAMYGYLKTGRCTTVYGHGGVIDTYIHDQQFEILNSKLDTIIYKLDEIRATQIELTNALEKNNNEMKALKSEIERFAHQNHDDSVQLLQCQRYANDCISWIATVKTYEWLQR